MRAVISWPRTKAIKIRIECHTYLLKVLTAADINNNCW